MPLKQFKVEIPGFNTVQNAMEAARRCSSARGSRSSSSRPGCARSRSPSRKGAPQGRAQDEVYMATWAVMIQFWMCLAVMFLFSQIGTDEERNVKNVSENKGGVWIVAIVKYLGLLLLYGGTIRVQCQDLKRNLVGKGREGTGRVRLFDFFKKDNVSNNGFLEQTRGAPDESSAVRGQQVIIPNYVQAPSSCLEVSAFYSICGLKECEGLLGRIEKEIRSPFATPGVLLEVAQRAINAREDEPRNQTTQLAVQSVMEAAWDTVQLSPLPAITVVRARSPPSATRR